MTQIENTGPTQGESITTGTVRLNDLCYLLVTVDELVRENVPFSRIYTLDRQVFGSIDVDWLACSSTVCLTPAERFLAIAQRGGHVIRIGGGETAFETIRPAQEGFVRKPGLMREIRSIGSGRAYAVGTGRQAYRRDDTGVWTCIDDWHQRDSLDLVDYSFESIDGFSDSEIYTVGWRGEIWHYDGVDWTSIASPTNLALHKVKCVQNDHVYISGKEGLLIRGRGESWEIIDHGATSEDIWDIEWFNDRVYVSTTNFIYALEGDELRRVDFGECPIPGSCYHLSARDGILWSIGMSDVVQFDGTQWTPVI